MILIMKVLNFLSLKGIIANKRNNICINAFCYENNLIYPVYVSNQKFKDCIDLRLITDEVSHIMCILRILTDLCVIRQNVGLKNTFAYIVYDVLVVRKY